MKLLLVLFFALGETPIGGGGGGAGEDNFF